MLPHPKTMQAITHQRWHELTVKTHGERLAMTRQRQTPEVTYLATLRLHVVNAVQMLQRILGRRLEIRVCGDAERPAVPWVGTTMPRGSWIC